MRFVPQLMLRIAKSGTKSWALLARFPGYSNPTRRTLGRLFRGSGRPTSILTSTTGAALILAEAREKGVPLARPCRPPTLPSSARSVPRPPHMTPRPPRGRNAAHSAPSPRSESAGTAAS